MFDVMKKDGETISPYDMLFGDLRLSYWASIGCEEVPWVLFKEVKKNIDNDDEQSAVEILHKIIQLPGLESRQYLQAYHFLNGLVDPTDGDTKVFGIVLEISMAQGNDTLAVYRDHSVRYYNYSGKSIIWEHPNDSLDELIDSIFEKSKNVLAQIGPWKEERPQPPTNQMVRINFLTSKGLHFGEGGQQALFNEPMAGKVMHALLSLMNALIDKSIPNDSKSAGFYN